MGRAVVIGSGPNGLSAACVLARNGWQVEVVEAAEAPGGALVSAPLFPEAPEVLSDLGASVHPLGAVSPVFHELEVEDHGVEWVHPPIPAAHGLDDGAAPALLHGGHLLGEEMCAGLERTADALGPDGPRWRRLFAPLVRHCDELIHTALHPPEATLRMLAAGAPMLPPGFTTLPRAARTAAAGAIGAMPATTLMRGFRTEQARSLLAGLAAHSTADLRLPLTGAFSLLFAGVGHSTGWPVVRGGSQRLVEALLSVLRTEGGTVTTGHRVTDPAALKQEREADVVLADLTPAQLLALDAQSAAPLLQTRVRRRLQGWDPGPGIVKVDWLIESRVPWRRPALAQTGTVHLGGPSSQVVAAEAALARGVLPSRPSVLFTQPAAADPARVVDGRQTCSAYARVPYGLSGPAVERVAAMIEGEVAAQAPGFARVVVRRRVWSPADLAAWNPNLAGGSLSGGVPTPGQLLRRPASFRRPYRMGPGLYLCSSSTPPGGGAHGMCGASAAAEVLAEHG